MPKLNITHKMPRGGDQGVKPTGEKSWPSMWHDSSVSGPSPLSISGRFEIMPGGSEIPMHKPKKFSFSGKKKVENHDEKEAEQRLALNLQLQAPPRKLPEYVYDDFITKRRNVNQLLNEFIQHRYEIDYFNRIFLGTPSELYRVALPNGILQTQNNHLARCSQFRKFQKLFNCGCYRQSPVPTRISLEETAGQRAGI